MLSHDSPPDDYDGRRRSPTRSNITSDSGDLKRRNINPKSAGCDKQNANIILILRYPADQKRKILYYGGISRSSWAQEILKKKTQKKPASIGVNIFRSQPFSKQQSQFLLLTNVFRRAQKFIFVLFIYNQSKSIQNKKQDITLQ